MKQVIKNLYSLKGEKVGTRTDELRTQIGLAAEGETSSEFIEHSLATAANDFLVASGSGVYVKKTLAETKAILFLEGIVIPSATTAGTCPLLIGAGISDGVTMTGTKNGLIRAFGQIKTSQTLSNDIRGIWGRVRVDAACDVNGGYQICGVQGSTKLYGDSTATDTNLWMHSGVYGSFETDDEETTTGADGRIAGVVGILGLGAGCTTNGKAAALYALSNSSSSITIEGYYEGIYIEALAGKQAFNNGIFIQANSVNIGITIMSPALQGIAIRNAPIGMYFEGISDLMSFSEFGTDCITTSDVVPGDAPSTGALGASGSIRIMVGSVPYYIPIFAEELS